MITAKISPAIRFSSAVTRSLSAPFLVAQLWLCWPRRAATPAFRPRARACRRGRRRPRLLPGQYVNQAKKVEPMPEMYY